MDRDHATGYYLRMQHRLMFVIGTRPEAVKLAPVIQAARRRPGHFNVTVVRTSQHREMLDQVMASFDLCADVDLDIMRPDQDLLHVTIEGLSKLHTVIGRINPGWILVQGDTTTTFVGALAAFYRRVRVAHVEAGLRSHDTRQPFPEEINRCLTARLTDLHCAPTPGARENLLAEGIPSERIVVTGNTAIDALLFILKGAQAPRERSTGAPTLLVTAHRRENHGEPLARICDAVLALLERWPELRVHYPVHLSPRVRAIVWPRLSHHPRVTLSEPLDYAQFVLAMHRADIILTDSGGVQEEAPALGKPVLVLRENTERPEALQAGLALLVGTDPRRIVRECSRLLDDPAHYASMSRAANPYGDGQASDRILDAIAAHS